MITNDYLRETIKEIKEGNPHYKYHALKKENLLPIVEELLNRRLNPDYDMESV